MSEANSHASSSRAIDRTVEDTEDARSQRGGSHADCCCKYPLDERRIGRHQKVRLWLTAMRQASWPGNGRRNVSAMAAAWGAFEDSGTFSADTCQCDDSQLRPCQGSTERSSVRKIVGNQSPMSRESVTTGHSSRSSRTSLNKLLQNKLKLLSCSTPVDQPGDLGPAVTREANSVIPKPVRDRRSTDHQRARTAPWMTVSSDGFMEYSPGHFRGFSTKHNNMITTGGMPLKIVLKSARESTPKRFIKRSTSGKSRGQKSATSIENATGPAGGGAEDCGGGGGGGGDSSGGAGGGTGDVSSSGSYEASNMPSIFHVRVLPAMCYLVWRPDMLRRECLMDRGQAAYLNALHPSALSMDKLMTAVAARLDIEVPLLSILRPDYNPEKARSFEYVFRWHTPNGPRVELTEHISDIQHPDDQNGTPEYPVRIFLTGSPGWLARAK